MSHNSLGTSYCRIPAKRTGISRKTSAFIAGRNGADREVPACFARGGTGRYGTLKVKNLEKGLTLLLLKWHKTLLKVPGRSLCDLYLKGVPLFLLVFVRFCLTVFWCDVVTHHVSLLLCRQWQ